MSLEVEPQTLFRYDFEARRSQTTTHRHQRLPTERGRRGSSDTNGQGLDGASGQPLRRRPENRAAPAAEPKPLDLTGLRAEVDPRQEWRQMYFEAWRLLRDYFYAPNMHGLDWAQVRDRYAPFLDHLGHRADLDFLIREMQGELVVGHAYISPGDQPGSEAHPGRASRSGSDARSRRVPHREDLQDRELECRIQGAARSQRAEGEGGRLHPGRRRAATGFQRARSTASSPTRSAERLHCWWPMMPPGRMDTSYTFARSTTCRKPSCG